jgi:hypothetical protein
MFGGGTQPVTPAPIDLGGAIEGLARGASSLLQNAVLRKLAQQTRERNELHAQALEQDRQAQLALAQQREAREAQRDIAAAQDRRAAAERADRDFQFKQEQAGKPKRHYDAARGVIVDEGTGVAAPVQNLPPAPNKAGQPHYDARRGVFVHPDGTVTKVEGLPAPQETPSEQRSAAGAGRAARRAEIADAKGALDEARRDVPRPSKAREKGDTPADDAKNPAFQQITQDSLAYERDVLGPARLRYGQAVGAPPAASPAPAPGRLRTPRRVNPDMQAEFDHAAQRYRRAQALPTVTPDEARAAYEATLERIRQKYAGREAVP